ncbi:transposase [Meiothermus hypogaeus]|uniref:transposase n=1 Tax=Meiothermus hypogaeus TaxID=884155 RepID=UPI003FCDF8F4
MRGFDGAKKVKGRKRHWLVDTQGRVLKVKVLPANLSDAQGGRVVLPAAWAIFKRLSHLFIDGGYKRQFADGVKQTLGWTVQVMRRPEANFRGIWLPMPPDLIEELGQKTRGRRSFVVIPRRWVVERTFAWLSFNRRLKRDYEFLPETTETFIYVAMIRLMVRRLAS